MVQNVLSGLDDESLSIAIVWTAVLANDNYQASIRSRELVPDKRVLHYWDETRALGTAVAPILGTRMQMAWDVYLAYEKDVGWEGNAPPAPADWLHQKRAEEPKRYMDEAKLEAMLRSVLD